MEEGLDAIYRLVDANPEDQFVFTSSGEEAITQVLLSCFLEISRKTGKCHFITSSVEDAASMQTLKRLEDLGCFVKIVPVNARGEIDTDELKKFICDRTALISMTLANGLTGVIQPIEQIAEIAKASNIPLHLDANHAVGKYLFSMNDLSASYITFSGSSIGAPLGTGTLFAKKEAPLVPLIFGGKTLRGGKKNPALFSDFITSATRAQEKIDSFSLELPRLRNFFEKEILRSISGTKLLFQNSLKIPDTCVISFEKAHQDALLHLLQKGEVQMQIGGDVSQNLKALLIASQIDPLQASCGISFCIPETVTLESLKQAISNIEEAVLKLRSICPDQIADSFPNFPQVQLKKGIPFRFTGSFSDEEAKAKGVRLARGEEKGLALYLLVDETDGEIADAKFQCFGPASFIQIGDALCELVIRKNISQASRINADLIEKGASLPKGFNSFLNCALTALDMALEKCNDIQCIEPEYENTPIAFEDSGHGGPLENWEILPQTQKRGLIESIIEKEIRPYIELDAGGIQIIELNEKNELHISYQGACTSCPSATGSTLSAIQEILRSRLSPKITVIPQFD